VLPSGTSKSLGSASVCLTILEEGLIQKAHGDGIEVLRRGDADPRAVLGIRIAQAQASAA
jgi:hypothetical protein